MLRLFVNTLRAVIFYLSVWVNKIQLWDLRSKARLIKKVKTTQMSLKKGESYRLGECVVTLATFGIEGKEEVGKKIEAFNALKALRHQELTEKAEKIMLMTPEELKTYQVDEWLKSRKAFNEKKYYENLK